MHLTRATYDTRAQKVRDFLIGFIGWFILNTLANGAIILISYLATTAPSDNLDTYQALQSTVGVMALVCNVLSLVGNIGLAIYFALTRYWIALGMLGAFAGLIILTICAAVVIGGVCFAMTYGAGSTP